jgi:hypothetical protein
MLPRAFEWQYPQEEGARFSLQSWTVLTTAGEGVVAGEGCEWAKDARIRSDSDAF